MAALPNVIRVVPTTTGEGSAASRDALTTRTTARFGDGEGQLRRGASSRRGRPHGVHAARADRLRRAVLLLHHPDDAGRAAEPAARDRARGGARVSPPPGSRRSRSPACTSDPTAATSDAGARRLAGVCSRPDTECATRDGRTSDLLFRISSLEPMDCTPEIVHARRRARLLRAALPPAAPARQRPDAAAMRRPYTLEQYSALVDDIRTPHPARLDRLRHHRRLSGRDRRRFRRSWLAISRRSPLTHLHVFPYSDRPGTEASAMAGKVPGDRGPRARPARPRDLRAAVDAASVAAQVGTRPSRADDRRWVAGGDRQLPEAEDSPGLRTCVRNEVGDGAESGD